MKLILIFLLIPWLLKAQDVPNPNELVIDQIVCEGNATTSCDLIQKEIYLNAGDKVNEEELSNAKIRLQVKSLFKSVNIYMQKGSERGRVNVVVQVEEGNPIFTETEFRSYLWRDSMNLSPSANFVVGHRNLFGKGKILQASIDSSSIERLGNSWGNVRLTYTDPHVFGHKKLFFNFSVSHGEFFGKRQVEEEYKEFGITSGSYFRAIDSYTASFGYRIFDFSYLSVSKEISKYSYVNFGEDTSTHKGSINTVRDTYTYGWNSEDDSYFPTTGSKFNFGFTKTERPQDKIVTYIEDYFFLGWNKTWLLAPNHTFTFAGGSVEYRDDVAEQGNNKYNGTFQYGYQLKNGIESEIQRSRIYVGMSPAWSSFQGTSVDVSTGIQLEHKKLGILKFGLTWWGSN